MTDSVDDYDAYFDPLDDEDLKQIDEKVDEVCRRFATLESPSRASTSRAKTPKSDETSKSDTDEIDFQPPVQPSMSPDRPNKTNTRQSRPRKSTTSSKRSPIRSNSPLTIKASRCPAPRQSAVSTKPLPLRSPSPDASEPPAAPRSESKPKVEEKVAASVTAPPASLLKMFRPWGRLSVTDLVTPSWCEYKFDYSLRGRRWRGVDMDDIVVSKHGKAIPVQKSVVIHAEKIMKQGQARVIHKKLEQELRVEEVPVKVQTHEERFALLLLNMIANFQLLAEEGTCRELQVMGFINGHYVTGIIDEINRRPAPVTASSSPSKPPLNFRSQSPRTPSPRKRKSKTPAEDLSQRRIDSYFPATPSKKTTVHSGSFNPKGSPAGVVCLDSDDDSDVEMKRASQESKEAATVVELPSSTPPEVEMRSANASQESEPPSASQSADQPGRGGSAYRLHLNDTKTRAINSMPKDDLSGRLQLMLYHQMLGRLVGAARAPSTTSSENSSSPLSFNFSFQAVLEHLHLKQYHAFSDEFIAEATIILDSFDTFSSSSQNSSQGKKRGSQSSIGSRPVENLDDVLRCWYGAIRRLRLELDAPIDDGLELIYRKREEDVTTTRPKGKKKTKSGDKQASFGATKPPARLTDLGKVTSPIRETRSPEPLEDTEERMLQHAIAESLRTKVQDSQSSNGTDDVWYTPIESLSQDPDYKPSGTFGFTGDSSRAKETDPLPTPPPSSSTLASAGATATSSTSQSRSPSPRTEKDEVALQNEAVEDHIADVVTASQGSQGSEMDWEALLGDKFISDAELASIELPAMTLSPTKRSLSQEQSSKGKGKAKAVPSPQKPPKSKSVTIAPSNQDSSIIGSKKFAFDQELLTKHMVAAIEFWESRREPRGVDLEDTWKCDTCEFREGCEWREAKAAEMARSRNRR